MGLRKFNEKRWEKKLEKLTIFQLIHIEAFCKSEINFRVAMAETRAKENNTPTPKNDKKQHTKQEQ